MRTISRWRTRRRRDAHAAHASREKRQVLRQDAAAPRRARDVVEQRVEPLHLPHERRDVERPRRLPGVRREPRALVGMLDRVDDPLAPAPPHRASARSRPCDRRRGFGQPVRVGRDDRPCAGQRLERGQRRALPERREHAQVEGRQRRRHILHEADEHEAIAEAEPLRLRLERGPERSLAREEEPRLGMRVNHQPRGVDQILVALRVVQARDRADRELAGSNAERLARGRDLFRRSRRG